MHHDDLLARVRDHVPHIVLPSPSHPAGGPSDALSTGVPPRLNAAGSSWRRRIVEHQVYWDQAGMLAQLGGQHH